MECTLNVWTVQTSIVSLLQRLENVMATCCMCRGGQEEEKEHGLARKESRLIVSMTYGSNAWTSDFPPPSACPSSVLFLASPHCFRLPQRC